MIRDDLSNKLIHLVRGDSMEVAFHNFSSILEEKMLRGGTGFIKGGYRCVCFTETPVAKLGQILANADLASMRYRPFGIMVDKQYAYEKGARPAIYQPDGDFVKLHPDIRYRHVRFELGNPSYPIDHTWEREWRIHCDEFLLPDASTTVIVPNREWRDILIENHFSEMQDTICVLGGDAAFAIQPYDWHIAVLEDLGIPIPDGFSD